METHGYNAAVEDNVVRRELFLDAHPLVTITHFRDPRWEWIAVWTVEGTRETVRDAELGGLLDKLDDLDVL